MTNKDNKFLYHPDGEKPPVDDKWIFVFGSNLAGRHGAGAAREALVTYGAAPGIGIGHVGNSFAIPTKDHSIQTRLVADIEEYITESFLPYAAKHSEHLFWVTRIGCGLAGYTDNQIAPLFKDATPNCVMPEQWLKYLEF